LTKVQNTLHQSDIIYTLKTLKSLTSHNCEQRTVNSGMLSYVSWFRSNNFTKSQTPVIILCWLWCICAHWPIAVALLLRPLYKIIDWLVLCGIMLLTSTKMYR